MNGLRAVVVCLVIACAAVVAPADAVPVGRHRVEPGHRLPRRRRTVWSTGRADGPEGTFAPRTLRFG